MLISKIEDKGDCPVAGAKVRNVVPHICSDSSHSIQLTVEAMSVINIL